MSRMREPIWKVSRRLSFSVLETGVELRKRAYAPGQHGPTKRGKLGNYALQLREKQRIRHLYGVNEKQFYNTFKKASKMKGIKGDNFMFLLESRLDNLVYRMGLARTRRGARQLVNHGHVLVNGKKVDIPSYTVKVNDIISLREKSLNLKAVNESLELNRLVPSYLDFDANKKTARFIRLPERSELNTEVNELLVVEFYNR